MNEKYGFVYLWRDRKHKRYYIGSHWGTENDGYVCSSQWMRRAYLRRPEDFRRHILFRCNNKPDLLQEEYRWLMFTKPEEIRGPRYYNLSRGKIGHWSAQDYEKGVKKRISSETKKAMSRPEIREKMLLSYAARDWSQTDETRKRRSDSMKKTMAEKFPIRRVSLSGEDLTEHLKTKSAEMWANRDETARRAIGSSISASLIASKQQRSEYMSSLKWWNNGSINRRCKVQPGPEWSPGRSR